MFVPGEAAGVEDNVIRIGDLVCPSASRTGWSAADFGGNRKPFRGSVRGGSPIVKTPGSVLA